MDTMVKIPRLTYDTPMENEYFISNCFRFIILHATSIGSSAASGATHDARKETKEYIMLTHIDRRKPFFVAIDTSITGNIQRNISNPARRYTCNPWMNSDKVTVTPTKIPERFKI